MEAPLHKLCGTRHWSNQTCPLDIKPTEKTMAKAAPKIIKSSPKAEARARPKPKVKKEAGPVTRRSPKPASKSKGRVAPAPATKPKKPAKRKEPKSLGLTQAIIDAAPKRGRGRPKTGFDKLAYQREYMKEYRAKKRAEKAAK
jgi:hypothetical protein